LLLEQYFCISNAIIVGSFRLGDKQRIGRRSLHRLIDEGMRCRKLSVRIRIGIPLNCTSKVMDGVLVSQFGEGCIAFFNVKTGTPLQGKEANHRKTKRQDRCEWEESSEHIVRNSGESVWH